MRLKAASILILILLLGRAVIAQRDCGDGLPCGKLSWDLPLLPALPSPTPIPTISFEETSEPEPTGDPTATLQPIPTNPPLATVDTVGIIDQVATLNAIMDETPITVLDINGTPVDNATAFAEVGGNAGQFFGYARTISQSSMGSFTPILNFLFLLLATVLSVKFFDFLLPVVMAVVGIVRKIIQVILDFIPL